MPGSNDLEQLRLLPSMLEAPYHTLTGWHPVCNRFSGQDKYHRETDAFHDGELIALFISLRA
jgi:hypothetical protein